MARRIQSSALLAADPFIEIELELLLRMRHKKQLQVPAACISTDFSPTGFSLSPHFESESGLPHFAVFFFNEFVVGGFCFGFKPHTGCFDLVFQTISPQQFKYLQERSTLNSLKSIYNIFFIMYFYKIFFIPAPLS